MSHESHSVYLKRLMPKVRIDPSGCWIWIGYLNRKGYGVLRFDGRNQGAHRVSYQLLRGPIPAGMTIDHLCRTTSCVNPDHLEPVSGKENTLRGFGFAAINARKTHCDKGHPYSGHNLIVRKNGLGRFCRTCRREESTRRRERDRSGRDRRRELKGESSPAAKLTWDVVRNIRSSDKSGPELSLQFKVSRSTISRIRLGETWRDGC